MGTKTNIMTMPEMLGRQDADGGALVPQAEWDVQECAPVRGMPSTSIPDRVMRVPTGDDEMERCVRAHEMMHAKISPGHDFDRWMNRGIATREGLISVEELRVNYLCNLAGFPMKKVLSDGGEASDGERCAISGDWAAAVYTTVAYMETASLNQFITGVRRHNPEWAASLRSLVNRVERIIKKIDSVHLAATHVDRRTSLAPAGFLQTERIAEFVDRIAHPPAPAEEDENEASDGTTSHASGDGSESDDSTSAKSKSSTPPPVDKDTIKKMQPTPLGKTTVWADLRPHRLPLNRPAPGGLGKRRSPTMIGRSPRRIDRMLTDPHRRIFDRVTRGNGGVVLIDGSGSMQLTQNDVRRIVEAAPGATVAVYSADNNDHPVNLWVLADRGRMVSEMPRCHTGNGVDLPAIEWAVEQRQRATSPVIWVTDGYVIPLNHSGADYEWNAFECMKVALKHKVVLRPTVDAAVEALTGLQRNKRPKVWWPNHWRSAYKKYQGGVLPRS